MKEKFLMTNLIKELVLIYADIFGLTTNANKLLFKTILLLGLHMLDLLIQAKIVVMILMFNFLIMWPTQLKVPMVAWEQCFTLILKDLILQLVGRLLHLLDIKIGIWVLLAMVLEDK